MNPTLAQWLNDHCEARAAYEEETRYLHVDQIPPARPLAMQFTITTTGLLRDHAGAKMGHVSEMSPLDLRSIGVDHTRLTARQRRTPVPRRNPDTTRQPVTLGIDPATDAAPAMHAIDALEAGLDGLDLTGIPDGAIQPLTLPPVPVIPAGNPWELTLTRTWPEDAIPEDAAPGDVVTDGDNRRIGIVGRNGRNEVVVVRDPNPLHDRLRRGHTVPVPTIDLSRLSMPTVPDLSQISEGFRSAAAAMAGAVAPTIPEEFHEGPRMLATLSTETGAAARYAEHTVTTDMALDRAQHTYHSRGLYATTARRMGEEDLQGRYIDRSAVQVGMFMARAYGIEFNDETLTAVTAMTATFARQAAARATRDGQRERELRQAMEVERNLLRDAAREADADAQHRGTITNGIISTVDPGPVEAAVAAAKAWKETGVEDSVAKLNSFKHLLDMLDQLAR